MIYYIIIFVCIYTTIDSIFLYSFIFFVIFIFVVNVLVQLCIILVRNGMFYKKKQKSSNLVTIFYYVIDTVYIYS